MKTNLKMIVLGFISTAVISGCSSTDKKTDEPINTPTASVSTYPSDPYIAPDEVTTTYSSADLGSSSSGMGR